MNIRNERLSSKEIRDLAVENKRVIIKGRKLGEVGDVVILVYKEYQLTGVDRIPIITVAAQYYRMAGFNSPEEFIEDWIAHNEDPGLWVYSYIHYFDTLDNI